MSDLRFLISSPSTLSLARGQSSLGSASKMSASSWSSSGSSSAHLSFHFPHLASSSLDLASASPLRISRLVFLTRSMTRNKIHLAPPRRNSSSMQQKLRRLIPQRWLKFSSLPFLESRIMRMQKSHCFSCPGLRFWSRWSSSVVFLTLYLIDASFRESLRYIWPWPSLCWSTCWLPWCQTLIAESRSR